jgi:hypothetical protein
MMGDMHKVKRASPRLPSSRLLKIVTPGGNRSKFDPAESDAPREDQHETINNHRASRRSEVMIQQHAYGRLRTPQRTTTALVLLCCTSTGKHVAT